MNKMRKIYTYEFGWISAVGGGVFSGKAAEDSLVEIGEDLSDIISDLSVEETPFLDALGDSGIEATNQLHEWLEDGLNPHIATWGANVTSDASAGFGLQVIDTAHMKAGMVLEDGLDGKAVHEQMLVTSINGATTITVDRAAAGTSATSHATNFSADIVASAEAEGPTPSRDLSTDRTRVSNLTQIIERNINITGTKQSVNNVGVQSEIDRQMRQRLRESLRELEESVIRGRQLTGSIVAGARRTMAGFISSITQITSIGALTSTKLDNLLNDVWDQGADPDTILVNAALKRKINLFPGSELRQNQDDRRFIRQVDVYEGFTGQQAVMQNRYMDQSKVAVGELSRLRVVPLRGRSFFATTLGRTGDSTQIQTVGEYTLEFGSNKSWALAAPATP